MITLNKNEEEENFTNIKSFKIEEQDLDRSITELYEIPLYIIEKVDLLYLSIKNESKYYQIMRMILVGSVIISYSWLWNILFMFSSNRQHIYCFNPIIHQFELCSKGQLCENYIDTISIIIYDDNNLSNIEDFEDEIFKVNRKYKDFFTENLKTIFSHLKPNFDLNEKKQLYKQFNAAVILSDHEHINVHMKYANLCNSNTSFIIFGCFVFTGAILGNFILSIFSDIFGRKITFLIGVISCAIFSLGFFTLTTIIDFKIKNLKDNFILNQRKHFDTRYVDILQQYYFTNDTKKIFKDYEFIFAIFLFLINFFKAAMTHSSLSLLVENSLNDRLVYKNFWLYNNGIIISIFYTYLFSFPFNDFKFNYLISGILLAILFYCALKYLHESPRLNFEYSEWKEYTEFFNKTNKKDCEELKIFYISETIYQNIKDFENRLLTERKEDIKESIIKSSKRGSVIDLIEENFNQFKRILKRDREIIITRGEVKNNPFLIIAFLIYEKKIRKNNPIIWAFIMIVFFLTSMISLSFLSQYFYTREGLFNIYILNSSFFHITLVFLFSNFFFYLIVPFFGFKKVIIVSFLAIFLFGLIIDLPMTDLPLCLGDLNRYNYTLFNTNLDEAHGRQLRVITFFVGFFLYGIYYNTYMYLFKYTKTIYRSTFFGIVDSISILVLTGSAVVSINLMWNFLIVSIVSLIGIFTVIFLEDKEENNIITDKKKYGPDVYGFK